MAWLTALVLFQVPPTEACSRSFPTYIVKSDFVVSVTNGGKPMRGIEVEINRADGSPDLNTAAWNRTNGQGELAVQLPAGRYFIVTRHADIEGEDAGELVVGDSPTAQSKLELHWPGHSIFKLRQVKGTFTMELNPAHPLEESKPLAGALIQLLDAASARQIGATSADPRGNFNFSSTLAPGLYILRVSEQGLEGKNQDVLIQGNIFVEVDANSEQTEIPKMNLVMTSCGLAAWTTKKQMTVF